MRASATTIDAMDERALTWKVFLPHDVRFPVDTPPVFLAPGWLGQLTERGDAWVGWQLRFTDIAAIGKLRMASFSSWNAIQERLRQQGFQRIRLFSVLPSLNDARWFIPLDAGRAGAHVWDLYKPFTRRARLQLALVRRLARWGLLHLVGDCVVLAQRESSPLELALTRAFGADATRFAIATGTPGPQRKVTLQVANQAGAVLGYAKYAASDAAVTLLRNEARALDALAQQPLVSAAVPARYLAEPFGNGFLLAMAPVANATYKSRTELTGAHLTALAELAARRGACLGNERIAELRQRVDRLSPTLEPVWRNRVESATARLFADAVVQCVPTVASHGDFAPWNIRDGLPGQRIALLDWEQFHTARMPLWDAFHFVTQVALRLQSGAPEQVAAKAVATIKQTPLADSLNNATVTALYLYYLADISCSWFEERTGMPEYGAADRTPQILRGQLIDTILNG